jgi:transcriptional regulator with XRE-family HTH domain
MGTRHEHSTARQRIASHVRTLRAARELSQEKLAEQAGFHRTYVSQLERGVTNISVDNLEKLAAVLAVDVSELLAPLKAR